MSQDPTLIESAEFSPKIKTYIMISVSFFLFISILGIPILLIWWLGLGRYVSRRYYDNLFCDLTTRHLEFRKGVLFKVEKTIPLENIQDLTFIQNPLLNLLELKILKIETAGQSNPQGSDMKLMGIIEAAEFKKKVLQQREMLRTQSMPSTTGVAPGGDESVMLLKEIRDLLREMKDK